MQHPGIHSRYTYRCLLVNRLYNKLLVIEWDVPDFTPGEPNLWSQSGNKRNIFKRCCNEQIFPRIDSNTQTLWDATLHMALPTQRRQQLKQKPTGSKWGKMSSHLPHSPFSLWPATLLTSGSAIGMVSTKATHSALPNTCLEFIYLKSWPKTRSMQTSGMCALLSGGFLYIMGGISQSISAVPHTLPQPQRALPCCVTASPVSSVLPSPLKCWAATNTVGRSSFLVFCFHPQIRAKAGNKEPCSFLPCKLLFQPIPLVTRQNFICWSCKEPCHVALSYWKAALWSQGQESDSPLLLVAEEFRSAASAKITSLSFTNHLRFSSALISLDSCI